MSLKSPVRPNPHPSQNNARVKPVAHLAFELKHRRKLKTPHLYSVEIHISVNKVVNKMLGVAFTLAQRQKYYSEFKVYEDWGRYHHYYVTLHSEPMREVK